MKILHYSDRQDPGLAELFKQCDVMFTTGDLSALDFQAIEKDIRSKPCFGVYGNHDNPGYLEGLGIKNVHLKVESFGQLSIGGYQGSPRYKERRRRTSIYGSGG